MAIDVRNPAESGASVDNWTPNQVIARLSKLRTVALNNATGIVVKGSAGVVYAVTITNVAAAARFVKLYDSAAAPVVGTDTPTETYGLAAGASQTFYYGSAGNPYKNGIGQGIVNLAPDTDTTAPTAGDVIVTILFA